MRLVEGRVLPHPEATAAVRECNSVEVEHYMAELQRQLSSHIWWLRSNQVHWGSLQQTLTHEFEVALNGGAILNWMLQQALFYGLPTKLSISIGSLPAAQSCRSPTKKSEVGG